MFRELLVREFAPSGALSSEQLDALEKHYELLMRWNSRINLTRIRKLDEMVRFHYCESLFLASRLPPGPFRVVDIGSGAGFPGFPLAVYRRDLRVTLLESHRRKAVFLSQASEGIGNITVSPTRAEECKERYDWIAARAVAPSEVLSFELAPNYALLIGADDLTALPQPRTVEKIPWGSHRLLVMFHVEHDTI
jgi:16S rRNA (guanine527-N7)-methyltransferase